MWGTWCWSGGGQGALSLPKKTGVADLPQFRRRVITMSVTTDKITMVLPVSSVAARLNRPGQDAHTVGPKDQVVQGLFEISPYPIPGRLARNGKKPGAGGRRPGGSQRPKMLRGCGKPQCVVELLRREPNQGTTTKVLPTNLVAARP